MPFSREIENLIASLRGLPEDQGVSRRREPRGLGNLIPELLHRHLPPKGGVVELIRGDWEKVVGPANAAYSQPYRLEGNRRLLVNVSNPVIRQELFFHRKMILERIRGIPGCSSIRELRLLTG